MLTRLGWDGHGKQRGKWTDIRCPFHDDRKIGNAGYNRSLNSFKCHACLASGNSVTLVMQQNRTDEKGAVEWLGSPETSSPQRDSTERLWGNGLQPGTVRGRL